MRTIWKYPIEITDKQTISIEEDAKFIHVSLDPKGEPCLWFECDDTKPTKKRTIRVFGTGHPLPDDVPLKHLGSFVERCFVWHVYW